MHHLCYLLSQFLLTNSCSHYTYTAVYMNSLNVVATFIRKYNREELTKFVLHTFDIQIYPTDVTGIRLHQNDITVSYKKW